MAGVRLGEQVPYEYQRQQRLARQRRYRRENLGWSQEDFQRGYKVRKVYEGGLMRQIENAVRADPSLTGRQLAESIGTTVNGIKSTLHRCETSLKELRLEAAT